MSVRHVGHVTIEIRTVLWSSLIGWIFAQICNKNWKSLLAGICISFASWVSGLQLPINPHNPFWKRNTLGPEIEGVVLNIRNLLPSRPYPNLQFVTLLWGPESVGKNESQCDSIVRIVDQSERSRLILATLCEHLFHLSSTIGKIRS